jgi:glycosyltransferase involved in cell wall biosynthesis
MRIAYLVNQYPKVSHSFIRREIIALEKQGIEVTRIALRGWDDVLPDAADEEERTRTYYVLRAGTPTLLLAVARAFITRPVRLLRALGLAYRMSRHADRPLPLHLAYLAEACCIEPRLRATGIQHLHAHFGTNSAEVAMLVRALGGPPWSFTVHGPEEFDRAPLIGLAEKVRDSAFVIAVSSFGRGQLYRLVEPQYWQKIQVVHCGLDQDFISGATDDVPEANRLVCVGRLCEQKGQLLLVEAARLLAGHGADFTIVLAGDGELRDEVEALIARYKLERNIRITGWISNQQVREEIRAAQALVLPSLAEGLPVVLMEAMALYRPVISTYVAGIPELVRPGEHGWLVPAGDVEELVEAMRACLNTSPAILTQMGAAAHDRVMTRHNVDVEVVKIADLFRNVGARCNSAEDR